MGIHILVVEDNPDNRTLLSWILEDGGYEYACVNSGERCLSYLEQNPTDLIIMDISLPGMSGKETSRRIRQIPALAHVPIIALTAYAVGSEYQDIAASGIDGILTKPVNEDELIAAMKNHLPVL